MIFIFLFVMQFNTYQDNQPATTISKIKTALLNGIDILKEAAWEIGTTILIIGYPLALGIIDDRFLDNPSLSEE